MTNEAEAAAAARLNKRIVFDTRADKIERAIRMVLRNTRRVLLVWATTLLVMSPGEAMDATLDIALDVIMEIV